jgi:hypothetical protein
MMDSDEILTAYVERFGELPDSRLMPPDVHERLPDMCRMALTRGARLTDDELELRQDPGAPAVL